jgi:arylformamidase
MNNTNLKNEANFNLRTRHPDFEDYFTKWRKLSKIARETLSCELDIAYGSGPNMTLDLFPAEGSNNPLLIFVHGGYWRSLDKSDHSFPALGFVPSGISVASINYALAPMVSIDQIVSQCRTAISWLYKNATRVNASESNIHISGHSAGGHLAAMMALTNWELEGLPHNTLKSLAPISGVFDLQPIVSTSINEDLLLNQETAIQNSPILLPHTNKLPSLISVGLLETDAFISQARTYAEICRISDSDHTFLGIEKVHHFNIITALAKPSELLTSSIIKHVLDAT